MSNPTNDQPHAPVTVNHPDWCDPNLCTATPAAVMGETHYGAPVTVTARGIAHELEITAHLQQAHCPWQTEVFVHLDLHGLSHDYRSVTGAVSIQLDSAAEIGRALTDLATTGKPWRERQIADELATLGHQLRATQDMAVRAMCGEPARPHAGEGVDR